MTHRFTEPQRSALLWLPADGSWSGEPGRMIRALGRLTLRHRALVEFHDTIGPRGGLSAGYNRRFRLTALGIEARKEIEG